MDTQTRLDPHDPPRSDWLQSMIDRNEEAIAAADALDAVLGPPDDEAPPPTGRLPVLACSLPADAPESDDETSLRHILELPYTARPDDETPNLAEFLYRNLDAVLRPAVLSADTARAERVEDLLLAAQLTDITALITLLRSELLAYVSMDNGFSANPGVTDQLLSHIERLTRQQLSIITTRRTLSRPGPVNVNFVTGGPQQVNIGADPGANA